MAMNPVGEWWNSPAMASMSSPLSGYADRMRAAMASAPAVDPLVAAYTPPAYQTTKPHVDVNAIIAAMRGDQNTGGGSAAPAVVVIPQGGDANVGGADRAVGGLPNMQEFRDAASSGKAAFGGLLSAVMGNNPDFQTGGLTMDTVGAGGGSVGPGTGSNSDPVGSQNSSNEPMGKGGYAEGGKVKDFVPLEDQYINGAQAILRLDRNQPLSDRKHLSPEELKSANRAWAAAQSQLYNSMSPEDAERYYNFLARNNTQFRVNGASPERLSLQAADYPGYKTGGSVKSVAPPNPPGPDDGVAALDKGEFVIRKDAAKALGTAALERLNAKDPDVINAVKRVIAGLEKRDASRGAPMVRDKDNDAQ